MELVFKELNLLVSPVMMVEGRIVEAARNCWNELEIDGSYVVSGRIAKQTATKSRFDFFAQKTESKSEDNWGFVSISDTRRRADFEIGVEDSVFENLIRALSAFGPQNARIDAMFGLDEFVPDIREGRGTVLQCAPQLWVKEWIKS